MAASPKDNELRLCRIYDAPVRAVWEAWTDSEKVAKWWGPRGFTITTHSKDLRPGGHWDYTMHGPDGTDYPNRTVYHEVETCARLVYDHGGHIDRPPLFRVTVTFREIEGRTHMDMTMALATPEAAREIRKFIKQAGGESTWDRLAEYLDKESAGKERFVINRSFPASVDTLFSMWIEPEHLAKWLGPTGSEMRVLRKDIRPGGSLAYVMTSAQGPKLHGRLKYVEISRPDRLVYAQQFCDEHENISRHPLAPVWPETMLTTVTFVAEGPAETRVTVNWEALGPVSDAELAAFVAARAGMTQGWTGSFDKLEELLLQKSRR